MDSAYKVFGICANIFNFSRILINLGVPQETTEKVSKALTTCHDKKNVAKMSGDELKAELWKYGVYPTTYLQF